MFCQDVFFGIFRYKNEETIEIPRFHPFCSEWGNVISTYIQEEKTNMPKMLDMVYLSIVERKFYSIEFDLQSEKMEEVWLKNKRNSIEQMFSHIVVGMAPYGDVSIWFNGFYKSILISWLKGIQTDVSMSQYLPSAPSMTLNEVCLFYINKYPKVKMNLQKNGLPPRNLFDKYMQQFCYRYVVKFNRWNRRNEEWREFKEGDTIPVFDYIEEALFDGTHDKLHDGGLLKYHEAGKPKKLAVAWHINRSEYVAYFWFEDEEIRTIYDRFYGTHSDSQVDFIIHIDAEKKKYQLAFFRSGLPQPVIIPERAYQLIVFKSKFENYRSNNYNQESGAWIW